MITGGEEIQEMIKNSVEELLKSVKDLNLLVIEFQVVCTHPNASKEARSNTGNWDPSADSYWYQCKCPDCQKAWTEEQK